MRAFEGTGCGRTGPVREIAIMRPAQALPHRRQHPAREPQRSLPVLHLRQNALAPQELGQKARTPGLESWRTLREKKRLVSMHRMVRGFVLLTPGCSERLHCDPPDLGHLHCSCREHAARIAWWDRRAVAPADAMEQDSSQTSGRKIGRCNAAVSPAGSRVRMPRGLCRDTPGNR